MPPIPLAPLGRFLPYFSIIRLIVGLATFAGFVTFAFGEQPPLKDDSQKLEIGVWRVPPGFISTADPSNKDGMRKPNKGFTPKSSLNSVQYDATEYLASQGVDCAEGNAIYHQDAGVLVVKSTSKNLDLIDSLVGGCSLGYSYNVAVELSFYKCTLPLADNAKLPDWPSYDVLRKLPASDIELLDRVSAITKSGHRVPMTGIILSNSKKEPVAVCADNEIDADSWGLFQDGELGIKADGEPIIGPDGISIDTNIRYRFRRLTKNQKISEISCITSFASLENCPIVVQVLPVDDEPGKFVVVTGNVRVVNSAGWKLKQLSSPEVTATTE